MHRCPESRGHVGGRWDPKTPIATLIGVKTEELKGSLWEAKGVTDGSDTEYRRSCQNPREHEMLLEIHYMGQGPPQR